MANGTSWLTHMWSGTVYQALLVMKHPETLHYQTNKEGIPVGSDTIVVLKNAPHPNTAQLFVNWMLAPENSSQNVKQIGYPMMTTAGLKTYDGLTKKYPWLKVTTGEVEHGQRFKPQDPEDPAALDHRLVEDPGVTRAVTRCDAASGRASSFRRASGSSRSTWSRWA